MWREITETDELLQSRKEQGKPFLVKGGGLYCDLNDTPRKYSYAHVRIVLLEDYDNTTGEYNTVEAFEVVNTSHYNVYIEKPTHWMDIPE